VPLAIPFFISNSINSYQDQTVKIFKQLDPNFKKIVNAQAQIDNLTKGTPLQSRASNQNLVLLKYLDQLNDPSFKEIEIDLGTRSIDVLMEGLPSYKLELIREILKLESLVLNDDALIEKDNKIYGNLLVTYDS
jgi:type II secretory pathway component PulL